jgi:alpha-galactosidase
VVLEAWKGDWLRGQNLWRRWMLIHNVPRPGGRLLRPHMLANSSRAYDEMLGADEAN